MISILFELVKLFFEVGILVFSISILTSYLILATISAREIIFYIKKNSFVDFKSILSSTISPSVSLLAPAYNEGKTIVENVRSLLSLHYSNYEVLIINDGSKDDSLQQLIDNYELEKVNFFVDEKVPAKKVLGVYKSKNPAFFKLTVVDKQNGGKADALNVGINVAKYDIVAAIDVDCIIEDDALLKMVKPFLEETEKKTIATGGVVRIANSCEVRLGRITKIRLPEKFLPRIQVLEYMRAFLLGRMAWSKLDGLLLISGAFGMFDKQTVINVGGYNHKTVGEDMELVVRMRMYMHEQNLPYRVAFIPDPLCWTEAPETWKILGRQRNRWTRGTAETLTLHKKLFFNSRYGILGMLSFPYWFFFEWLAPLIEFTGFMFFLYLVVTHQVYWMFFLCLLGVVYCFALFLSTIAILSEEISFHQYKKTSEMLKLIGTAMVEPLFFHPITVYWAIKGNIDLIRGKKSWGEMSRTGFANKKTS